MNNIVQLCNAEGCPLPDRASHSDQEVADWIKSNGDTVAYADRCPGVCRLLGARVVADIESPSRLAVVAGDEFGVSVTQVDTLGHSAVIGDDPRGEITLGFLNGMPYPLIGPLDPRYR